MPVAELNDSARHHGWSVLWVVAGGRRRLCFPFLRSTSGRLGQLPLAHLTTSRFTAQVGSLK